MAVLVAAAATSSLGFAAPLDVRYRGGWSNGQPHPAVVRVIAAEENGMSLGSGTLTAVNGDHGLVVTNWHVVRDAKGLVIVAFPDGFRSPANVLGSNSDWDLAALAIWRPAVAPVPLAAQPPRPGDSLTIAGYGSGQYRAASGRCTQYVAPGNNMPFEMVELSVAARQGDSGGPIFNERGELAGVLFGASFGTTSGSYCGRVRWFLDSVSQQFYGLPPLERPPAPMVAAATTLPPPPALEAAETAPAATAQAPAAVAGAGHAPPWTDSRGFSRGAAPPPAERMVATGTPVRRPRAAIAGNLVDQAVREQPPAEAVPAVAVQPPVEHAAQQAPTMGEHIKTLMAGVGLFAILFHTLRLLSLAQTRG